jgi:hypothetical protein
MEDGIERMMSPELYNIHFLNQYKNDKLKKNEKNDVKNVKDLSTDVKDLSTDVKDLSTDVKDSKEQSTNPQ